MISMSIEHDEAGRNENSTVAVERAIISAADMVYAEIARSNKESPNTIFTSRLCESVNESLLDKLTAIGIKAEKIHYAGWDITDHYFILATLNGEKYVIDPTWQQFLKEPDASRSKVLMVRIQDLDNELDRLGIPADKHHIWQGALSQQTA